MSLRLYDLMGDHTSDGYFKRRVGRILLMGLVVQGQNVSLESLHYYTSTKGSHDLKMVQ